MPYPPLPVMKQYPDTWHPAIPTRAVPVDDKVKDVDNSSLALHPESNPRSSESLGAPKKMDLGVLSLWLEGASRTSRPYDDGPSFDYAKHGITKPAAGGDDDFNIAPGTDEA